MPTRREPGPPRFLDARDRLPQALQHDDPSSRNLFRCADTSGATGATGATGTLRLGYLLATAEHYLAHPLMLALLDESEQAQAERARGVPVEEFMRRLSRVVRRGHQASVEARELLAQGALR